MIYLTINFSWIILTTFTIFYMIGTVYAVSYAANILIESNLKSFAQVIVDAVVLIGLMACAALSYVHVILGFLT